MTITEVCKQYGFSADTLRYYEKIGLLPTIERSAGGIRNYSEADCSRIEFIKCMRSAGVAIEPLIEYINLFSQGDASIARRKEILMQEHERIVNQLTQLQETAALLEYKISHYDELTMRPRNN